MALYLKYRPQDFSSLVGQEFIKTTLKTAVEQNKTVGAYLFTGGRGTGKTSTARILAKAVNCLTPKSGNPCGECDICKDFSENSLIDIIEIDAASHTWVDNIREIIEKAQFQPTRTKYKIYIIDEVHMLSKGAFNALLKILEEPPEHIKFILATTEIHKIPETILSRCQRYDFRNFSNEDISSHLNYIARQEKIKIDQESLGYIVKNAEGGMRNAISLFEQLIVDDAISFEYIVETLWIASEDEKDNFLKKMLEGDTTLLEDFISLKSQGKNLKNFLKDITKILSEISIEKIKNGEKIEKEITLLDILQDTLMKTKNSFDESMTIKIGLLKILAGASTEDSSILQKHPSSKEIKDISSVWVTHIEEKIKWISWSWSKIENHREETFLEKGFWKREENKIEKNIIDQAQDIFASSLWKEETKSQIINGENFDIKAFISAMKTQGAKAAATMSMMGSVISLEWEKLRIQTKTKISLNTLQKTENQEYMFAAGEKLGIRISNIEIS